jgi:hypothetical protein
MTSILAYEQSPPLNPALQLQTPLDLSQIPFPVQFFIASHFLAAVEQFVHANVLY